MARLTGCALAVVAASHLFAACGEAQPPGELSADSRHALEKKKCVSLRSAGELDDATISQGSPFDGQGEGATLTVGATQGLRDYALLRFDLSAIPPGTATEIRSAKLRLSRVGDDQPAVLEVHRVTEAWDEDTVTWQGFAGAFDPTVEATVDGRHPKTRIDDLVESWVHGVPNHGLLLGRTDALALPDEAEAFVSGEGNRHKRPELEVCYKTVCAPGTPGCGLCATSCSLDHASADCVHGVCRLDACQAGFADCNQNPADGCEASLSDDAASCGVCGRACGEGGTCSAGVCAYPTCAPGEFDCNRDVADGCDSSPCGVGGYCTLGSDCASGVCGLGYCAPAAGYVRDWLVTPEPADSRDYVTAALLADGRVMVSGGVVAFTPISNAELYSPIGNVWYSVPPMNTPRVMHTMTVLPNGIVVVTGGLSVLGGDPLDSIETYNPATGNWQTLPQVMSVPRWLHTATALANGDLLITGGTTVLTGSTNSVDLLVAGASGASGFELIPGPPLAAARSHHTATPLHDGRVLVASGLGNLGEVASGEVYDPLAGTWLTTGPMHDARYFHAATLLGDGRVLVTGGAQGVPGALDSTEIYDPATNAWTLSAPMSMTRYRHTATRMQNGQVLVAGGLTGPGSSLTNTAALFEPSSGTWSPAESMVHYRYAHAAVALPDGRVLVVGGSAYPPGAEVYTVVGAGGALCAHDGDCQDAHCVDGVCCDTGCGGGDVNDCMACSAAAGAPVDGTCALLTGTSCGVGSGCAASGTCSAGACTGGPPTCPAPPDSCYDPGVCRVADGVCDYAFAGGAGCASAAPDLDAYLAAHPNVASAIEWQFRNTSECCATAANSDDMRAWPFWSEAEKDELRAAYLSAWHWYFETSTPLADLREYLPEPAVNIRDPALIADDNKFIETRLSEADARALFIASVAQSLLVELGDLVPWRLADYDQTSLLDLLSSATLVRRSFTDDFVLAEWDDRYSTYALDQAMAPPRSTYAFMAGAGNVGADPRETIGKTLDWSRYNHAHFVGSLTNSTADATWQVRGNVPLSRVIAGTPNSLSHGDFRHWTAGCHGTVGFLKATLRTVNIPVRGLMYYCSDGGGTHRQVYFPTEDSYIDHGDNPYSRDFRESAFPSTDLLVDRPTYMSWTGGSDGLTGAGWVLAPCANVGRRVRELVGP